MAVRVVPPTMGMPNTGFQRFRLASFVCALGAAGALGACATEPVAPAAVPDRDAFAREWITLFETDSQPRAEAQLRTLRDRWLGRRVTWEVAIIEPFCRAERSDGGTCNVRAFDFAKLPPSAQAAMGGALPLLELGREDYLTLTRQCLPLGTKCVARVEAQLAELTEDTDAPLRLRLGTARLLEVRAARADERFERIVRPRVARRALPRSARPDRS